MLPLLLGRRTNCSFTRVNAERVDVLRSKRHTDVEASDPSYCHSRNASISTTASPVRQYGRFAWPGYELADSHPLLKNTES